MTKFVWLHDDRDQRSVASVCQATLGVRLHPSALEHLVEIPTASGLAFPRLERHEGYLFGTLFVPSNVTNPAADYDSIVFVATHDAVVAQANVHPTSIRDWADDERMLFAVDTTDDTPDGGQFILNALQLVVRELISDARTIRDFLRSRSGDFLGGVDVTTSLTEQVDRKTPRTKDRRSAIAQIKELLPTAQGIASEMPAMKRIARETAEIIQSLVDNDDQRDLHVDLAGAPRELFSRNLEIFLIDCLLDSRQLMAMLDEIATSLEGIFDHARRLAEEENVAAGRFTGAIASIMLLPTFIVGLYGQNFAEIPETDWAYGYLFSWGAIIVLTIGQIWFFRKRRWI